ncbi:hypothetical protein, partial [Ornithobacterium rhinotracheale]|uniref:hypothetical protein n=1 Tax=Ornithobacterium rhinotracheale TaxID=28251 RepID=UPI003873846C
FLRKSVKYKFSQSTLRYENKLKLYNAGRLLSNDLAQTKYLYQQAQTEYLQSVYDYLSAVNQFNTDWEVL